MGNFKIAIIGAGNMGGAIVRGLLGTSSVKADNITVADPSEQILESFKSLDNSINTAIDNRLAADGTDIVIVAVKPWFMEQVISEISDVVMPSQILISIAAGVEIAAIRRWFGEQPAPAVFRVMPNTAITVAGSMTMISTDCTEIARSETVISLFGKLGEVIVIDESQMTAATALASCGIAYALRYIEAAVEGGMELGFGEAEARKIVMQTVEGALAMLRNNGSMPQAEIVKVTTPGGITQKGLNAMEEAGFTKAVIKGLKESK